MFYVCSEAASPEGDLPVARSRSNRPAHRPCNRPTGAPCAARGGAGGSGTSRGGDKKFLFGFVVTRRKAPNRTKKSKKIQARFLGFAWSGLVSAWINFGPGRSASWHDNVGSSVAAFAPNTQESLAELPPTGRGGRPLRRRHRSTNAFSI